MQVPTPSTRKEEGGVKPFVPSILAKLRSFPLRKECTADLNCRTNHLPSLLTQPPQRFLPKLSGIDDEEASARLHYWGSILLLLSLEASFLLALIWVNKNTPN